MIGSIAAATLAAAVTGAGAPVAPCMLANLTTPPAQIAVDGMDAIPEAEWRAASATCGLTGQDVDNAEFPFGFYVESLRAARRIADKWSPERLATVVDAIPEEEIKFFWMSSKSQRANVYLQQEAAAWSKVYQALGERPMRVGEAFRDGDVERYIIARVGWRIGEIELAESAESRSGGR